LFNETQAKACCSDTFANCSATRKTAPEISLNIKLEDYEKNAKPPQAMA